MGELLSFETKLYINYKINNRLTGEEDTIEDIYAYSAYRFMALGCLDGPSLPFYSKESDV